MTTARVARIVSVLSAPALAGLWIILGVSGPALPGTSGAPLPDAAVPPVLLGVGIFSALALAAGAAALRDAPLVVILCGGISLVPVGLYTLVLPLPFRLIGVLDATLIVAGVLQLRGDRDAFPERDGDGGDGAPSGDRDDPPGRRTASP